jgi:23S rRNA (cytosine1962-C5)-methyltransferase
MRKRRDEEPVRLPEAGEDLPVVAMRTLHASTHPWIFKRMIGAVPEELDPGTLVEVRDKNGDFVGRGFFNPHSEIAVRLLTLNEREPVDRRWFHNAVARAVQLRHDVLKLPAITDSYRVVHSEGDNLSGLVVDKYGQSLVLQLYSAGMHRHIEWLRAAFSEAFPQHEIIVRSDHRTERLEGVKMDGPPPETPKVVIRERELKMHVDLRRGHKTGYFLDQRDNRRRVAAMSAGEDVFDGFCYTGGFALSAALAGAKSVEAVDLDEKAVEVAELNGALNGLQDKVRFAHGNVFDVLRERRTAGKRYTRVILDPAKLALTKDEVPRALSAYADMNRLGMHCLQPGGVLVSCSCTGLVSEEDFLMALRAAANEAGMDLQVIAIHGAAGDHPWALRVPEGRYLKTVFSRVMPLR